MTNNSTGLVCSPLRARLASFEHAYAVAIQLKRATGRDHYVVATGMPLQPFVATSRCPAQKDAIRARVA